jgi:hypothetical protein
MTISLAYKSIVDMKNTKNPKVMTYPTIPQDTKCYNTTAHKR